MPSDYSRTDRIGEQIKRELAMLIRNEIKDPRVGMVSVVDVQVSSDLKIAKVYFDILQEELAESSEEGLNRASGFLRRALGKTLKLRSTPALQFIYDDTEVRANQIEKRIQDALKSDQKDI